MENIRDESLFHVAAIGLADALTHYGLNTVVEDIGNPGENSTVFLLLKLPDRPAEPLDL